MTREVEETEGFGEEEGVCGSVEDLEDAVGGDPFAEEVAEEAGGELFGGGGEVLQHITSIFLALFLIHFFVDFLVHEIFNLFLFCKKVKKIVSEN